MKGYIDFFVNDDLELIDKISVCRGILESHDYSIDFFVNDDERVVDTISNSEIIDNFENSINFCIDFSDDEEYLEFYQQMKTICRDKSIFTNCDKCFLHGDIDEISKFLNINIDYFKNKDVVIGDTVPLSEELLFQLKEKFVNFPNIKLRVSGNEELVSIEDYEKTFIAINVIADKINQYNYSPFEKLIYAYDLIRDRFYVKEEKDEKYTSSRDLTSSLLGDKIVCLGFANIFKAVCDKLDINSLVFYLKTEDVGHARNLVQLKDEEYGIDGLYFFDPTFDCKKDKENRFLFSYKHFAKTFVESLELSGYDFEYSTYEYFDPCKLEDLELEFDEELEFLDIVRLISKTKINVMLSFLGEESIEANTEFNLDKFIDTLYRISDYANKQINSNQFIKALYKVRRNQYYEEPTKYLFDIDALTCILVNSKFVVGDNSPFGLLLAGLGVNRTYNVHTGREKVQEFLDENVYDVDMERVRLTRTLKSIYEQRKVNEEEKTLKKKM